MPVGPNDTGEPMGYSHSLDGRVWHFADLGGLLAKATPLRSGDVLAHVTSQLDALNAGLPVDLVFQSIAGTEAANRSFGITLAMLREARDADEAATRLWWLADEASRIAATGVTLKDRSAAHPRLPGARGSPRSDRDSGSC